VVWLFVGPSNIWCQLEYCCPIHKWDPVETKHTCMYLLQRNLVIYFTTPVTAIHQPDAKNVQQLGEVPYTPATSWHYFCSFNQW